MLSKQQKIEAIKKGLLGFTRKEMRKVDLQDADLHGVNLRDVDLRDSDLRNINLQDADLYNAKLQRCSLHSANLSNANLKEISLDNACLLNTNLTRADLSNAYLCRANLRKANLNGANLKGADLHCANLRDVDLRFVKNLSDANLCGVDLTDAKLPEPIIQVGRMAGYKKSYVAYFIEKDIFQIIYKVNLTKYEHFIGNLSDFKIFVEKSLNFREDKESYLLLINILENLKINKPIINKPFPIKFYQQEKAIEKYISS